jgi:hypothetical protein
MRSSATGFPDWTLINNSHITLTKLRQFIG